MDGDTTLSRAMSSEDGAMLSTGSGKPVEDVKVVDTVPEYRNALEKRSEDDDGDVKVVDVVPESSNALEKRRSEDDDGDVKVVDVVSESRNALEEKTEDLVVNHLIPQYLLEDIFNRIEEAKYIALAQLLCKDWRDAGNTVRSLRVTVLDVYHVIARDLNNPTGKSFRDKSLKETFLDYIIKKKQGIVQLRMEVEPKLQSKTVPEGERRRTDFWLTDPYFLRKWLYHVGFTLQHLCIVDYGQQAIMRRSGIIKILSETCHYLKTLDLRNMFIDTNDAGEMPNMISLTLRCVKVVAEALKHINDTMPNLQTLALLGVFGAEGGVLTFREMKVLCLGLSTPAKDVLLKLPKLEKLQLKMQCPEKLIIEASVLKYVAFNLEVLEPSKVDLRSMVGLEELLYGATSFLTLADLVGKNLRHLVKVFLDIPCMALGEDGRFLGVIKEINLQIPTSTKLHQCENLSVLNIGPGLWHSMETQVGAILEERWPSVRTLILHMICFDIESSLTVLRLLLRPSVTSLTVFIHTSSPVMKELLVPRIEEVANRQNIVPIISSWTKSLDFSCFSF